MVISIYEANGIDKFDFNLDKTDIVSILIYPFKIAMIHPYSWRKSYWLWNDPKYEKKFSSSLTSSAVLKERWIDMKELGEFYKEILKGDFELKEIKKY